MTGMFNESASRQDLNRVASVIGIVLSNRKKPNLGMVNLINIIIYEQNNISIKRYSSSNYKRKS